MIKRIIFLTLLMMSLAPAAQAQPAPTGWLDQVVFEQGAWQIKGWACQPGYGHALTIQVYLNDSVYGTPVLTNRFAEPAIHEICATSFSSGIPYRFSIAYPTYLPIYGQRVRVVANGSLVADLAQSNEVRMPLSANHPDAAFAAANRILIFTAHPDDEISFASMLAQHCPTKVCKLVVASSDNEPLQSTRQAELLLSAAKFPLSVERGNLSSNLMVAGPLGYSYIGVQETINRWNRQLAENGLSLNVAVQNIIHSFQPDVILTFDPRHGTSCHSEHRAVGRAVLEGVQGYTGNQFNVHNLFFLTSIRTGNPPSYIGFTTPSFLDSSSVEYSADEYNFHKGKSGWEFAVDLVGIYASQFTQAKVAEARLSENRAFSYQRFDDYIPTDSRYNFSSIPGGEMCRD